MVFNNGEQHGRSRELIRNFMCMRIYRPNLQPCAMHIYIYVCKCVCVYSIYIHHVHTTDIYVQHRFPLQPF